MLSFKEHQRLAIREQDFLARQEVKDNAFRATFEAALPKIDEAPLNEVCRELGRSLLALAQRAAELDPQVKQLVVLNLLEEKLKGLAQRASDPATLATMLPDTLTFLMSHSEQIVEKVRKKILGAFGSDTPIKIIDIVRGVNRETCGELETAVKSIGPLAEDAKQKLDSLKSTFGNRLREGHSSSISSIEATLVSLISVGQTGKTEQSFHEVLMKCREVWDPLRDDLLALVPPKISDEPAVTKSLRQRKAVRAMLGDEAYLRLWGKAFENTEAAVNPFPKERAFLEEYLGWCTGSSQKGFEDRPKEVKDRAASRIKELEGVLAKVLDETLAVSARMFTQHSLNYDAEVGGILRDYLSTRFKISTPSLWIFSDLLEINVIDENSRALIPKELATNFVPLVEEVAKLGLNQTELRRQLTWIGKCTNADAAHVVELILHAVEAKRPAPASPPPAQKVGGVPAAAPVITSQPVAAVQPRANAAPVGTVSSAPTGPTSSSTAPRPANAPRPAVHSAIDDEINVPALPPEPPEANFDKLVARLERYHGLVRQHAEEIAGQEMAELVVSGAEELLPYLQKALEPFGKRLTTASHIFKAICRSPIQVYEWGSDGEKHKVAKFEALARVVTAWESLTPGAFIGMLAAVEGRERDVNALIATSADRLNYYAEFIENNRDKLMTIIPPALKVNRHWAFFDYLPSCTPVKPKSHDEKSFAAIMGNSPTAIVHARTIIADLARAPNQTGSINHFKKITAGDPILIKNVMMWGVTHGLFIGISEHGDDFKLPVPRDVRNPNVRAVLLEYLNEDGILKPRPGAPASRPVPAEAAAGSK